MNWTLSGNNGSCSTYDTQPFPPVGPDVTGGVIFGGPGLTYGGHAYNIPAEVAWKNLPIDTSYQGSYTITASSWSSGAGCPFNMACETLSTAGTSQFMGEFQISAGPCAGTFYVSNSISATQLQYLLPAQPAGDPNACTSGKLLWPDVRQFGSTVYQSDGSGSGGSNPPAAPRNLRAVVN